MYKTRISETGHDWQKLNLVTKIYRKGLYEEMICKNCGIKGRSYQLGTVDISESYSKKRSFECPKAKSIETKRIKIIKCTAQAPQFNNITPGSEHDVVTPPDGYNNDASGVWVMGVGEPVKVLSNEFNKLN